MSKKSAKEDDLRNDEILRDDLLAAALVELGLDAAGSTVERAERLEAHYLSLPQPVGWNPKPTSEGGRGAWGLKCKIGAGGCGYHSTADRPFCDFCGDGDGKDEAAEAPSTALAKTPAEDAIEGELVEDGEGLPAPDAEPGGTEQDLDAAVALVNERKRALEAGERGLTGNIWDLGGAVFHIFKGSLYLARKKAGGGPLYPSFGAFCKAEIGMSRTTAELYARIHLNFPRELAQEFGSARLALLLPAAQAQAAEDANAQRLQREPRQILPPLLERARVLSSRDLRTEVKAAAVPTAPATGRARGAEAAAAKRLAAKQPEPERLTVQRQEGAVKLKFYRDEEAARAGDKAKAAKKFADGIVAVEPAVNGVECVYTLVLDAKRGPLLSRRIVRLPS